MAKKKRKMQDEEEKEQVTDRQKKPINNKLWLRFIELSGESTAHGYHNIFKTRLTVIRLMWISVFIVSTAIFTYLLMNCIREFQKHEVKSTTSIAREPKMKLPMLSFCNSKPMMTKFASDYAIEQFINAYSEVKFKMSLFARGDELTDEQQIPANVTSILYGNFTDPNDFFTFNNDLQVMTIIQMMINRFADPAFNQSMQQEFGLTYEQFFNQFSMNSEPVSSDFFHWYFDPTYGNCWRFNSGVMQNGSSIDILEQTATGYGYGVWSINFLDVFANQTYNFMNTFNVNTMGLKISIDEPSSIPLYYYNMLSLKPGTCTYINMKKIVTINLPYPYTNCQDLTNYHSILYDKFSKLNKTYSQKVCFELCRQWKLFEACNCSVNSHPNVDNLRTCQTWEEITCFKYISQVEPLTRTLEGCERYCPLECESVSYDYTITTDDYPDETNFWLLKTDSNIDLMFQNANVSLANASFESLAKSVACVYVYFQDFQTTVIEQTAAMTEVS
jgi:hypothetical protein